MGEVYGRRMEGDSVRFRQGFSPHPCRILQQVVTSTLFGVVMLKVVTSDPEKREKKFS